jgi:lysyl-tRNA synthetase class 2
MRKEMTDAERAFWWQVRDRRFYGHKFRRQYLIGKYIADFVCLERRLVVEIDGSQHAERTAYDLARDTFIASQGFRVLCFWNGEILTGLDGVMQVVLDALGGEAVSPSP